MSVPEEYIRLVKNSLSRHQLHMSSVLENALRQVPRSRFVGGYTQEAYKDRPLAIPKNQTISAPHMYAIMLSDEIADLHSGMDVLEIGTGSGYGAALLALCATPGKVVSIERHRELVTFAEENLKTLGLSNLTLIHGDGTNPDLNCTFDRIFVTAAGPYIPPSYSHLLRSNGRLVMPLEKNGDQWLVVVRYPDGKQEIDWKFRVRFVPLIGDYGH